jgi:hypothetical protein
MRGGTVSAVIEEQRVAKLPQWARPVSLRVICRQRWAHLMVDPDPAVPAPKPAGLLDERGRGLGIVEALAALHWFSAGDHGKTAHAVVTRPNVLLSADEVDLRVGRDRTGRGPGA